ncbi:MAG: hypothetical protein U0974_12335 [Gemmatimonadales bacterium]|nr:hypothetical protein [Gemmatimonadales bacterium]MDZ4390503.1 hypothetical protein [Gemmatimonadales bacterium]
MATREQIPAELTLELGDDPSPAEFLSAARAWFRLVQEVARSVTADRVPIQWVVHVREGSNLLAMVPHEATPPDLVRSTRAMTAKGLRSVARGKIDASGFTPAAITHLRELADLTTPDGEPGLKVRAWIDREPLDVTPRIASVLHEDDRAGYKDIGTVEGRLETILERHTGLQFEVRDALLRQTVRCHFTEEMLPKAFKLFRKRVEVAGLIKYRRNGTPVSVDVATVDQLPDDSKLPTVKDVRGLLKVAVRR